MPFVTLPPGNHDVLTGVSADDHHDQSHTSLSHTTFLHDELTDVGANDHHVKASQANVEAEAVNSNYITPDRARFSPGVAKVWVHWEQTGAHGILASYNMTSVTDGSNNGLTDHLWDDDFSGVFYAVICSSEENGAAEHSAAVENGSQAATGLTTVTFNTSGGQVDQITFLAAFGDQ